MGVHMKRQITVANLIMGIGGIITFLFSFFNFFSDGGFEFNAWDTDAFAFATTVPAILGLAMVVWVVLELAGVGLPQQVLTYTAPQMKGTWGIGAAGIMLSWISTDAEKGIGFWFMFLGSLAMAVGAVMGLLGKGTDLVDIPGGGSASASGTSDAPPPPPPPGGTPPPPPPSS